MERIFFPSENHASHWKIPWTPCNFFLMVQIIDLRICKDEVCASINALELYQHQNLIKNQYDPIIVILHLKGKLQAVYSYLFSNINCFLKFWSQSIKRCFSVLI